MMKKITAVFTGILLLLFLLLSIVSAHGRYAAEKMFWKTNEAFRHAIRDPETTPQNVYQDIAADYRKIVEKFPGEPQIKARAQLQIGRTLLAQKDFLNARKAFQQVFVDYPNRPAFHAEAAFSIAKTYELENNWAEASKIYDKIIKDYPLTNIGLSLPLLLANHYVAKGNVQEATKAFKRATRHYNMLIQKNPNSAVALQSMNLLAKTYVAQEEWGQAIEVMGQILLGYPNSPFVVPVIQSINTLALVKLQDSSRAERIYKRFIKQYPNHKLDKALNEMLTSFKNIKEKSVKIVPATNNP